MGWGSTNDNPITLHDEEDDEMKQVIKQSDCNRCGNRNCEPSTFGKMHNNCKLYKPVEQTLGNLFKDAFANNSQAAISCLNQTGLKLPKEPSK
jgi:hypothetical protein